MKRLSHKSLALFSSAIAELYRRVSLESLGTDFNEVLGSLIPAQYIATNFFSEDNVVSGFIANRELPAEVSLDFLYKNQLQNPNVAFCHSILSQPFQRNSIVTRWSDFATLRQIRETEIYREAFRYFAPTDEMMLLCPKKPHIAVGLTREQGSFSEEEVAILELMGPHFENALAQSSLRARIREAMNVRSTAANFSAGLVVSETGEFLFSTEEARRLMSIYLPKFSEGELPKLILDWFLRTAGRNIPLRVQGKQGLLIISYTGSADYRPWDLPIHFSRSKTTLRQVALLKIVERPLVQATSEFKGLGLTPKECEILSWVEMGKSNDEISTIMGSAIGTVKKHLENIYRKLGVENRFAAAALARDAVA